MKKLALNFSSQRTVWHWTAIIVVQACLLILLINLIMQHSNITQEIQAFETKKKVLGRAKPKNIALTELEIKEQKLALGILRALNIPWNELLIALEQVQSSHPKVTLVFVQPNPTKNEVMISGEARSFSDMMAYVETLKQKTIIQDVTLVNQSWIENEAQRALAFTLHAEWKF